MIGDLKLAHYMKINPKHMFLSQLLGTVIGCVMNYIVICVVLAPENGYRAFLDGSGMYTRHLPQFRTRQGNGTDGTWMTTYHDRKVQIFRSASIIWGAVGPERFFAGSYKYLYGGFALGFLLPLVPWLLHKQLQRRTFGKLRESVFSRTVVPILLHGAIAPPATPTNVRACANADHARRLCVCISVPEMGARALPSLVPKVQVRFSSSMSAMSFPLRSMPERRSTP